MGKSKGGFYAVARGRSVGVFTSWPECKKQVDGFTQPRYKKFETREEAEAFIVANSGPSTSGADAKPFSTSQRKRANAKASAPESDNKRAKIAIPDDVPVVYTDGACSQNGKKHAKAGWGVYWGPGHEDNECGPVSGPATNNRGELEAVSKAIDKALSKNMNGLLVRTDSQLLINSLDQWIGKWKKNGWKTGNGEAVKNEDLLKAIDDKRTKLKVYFEHVPAHVGIVGNEAADELARQGARMYGGEGTD